MSMTGVSAWAVGGVYADPCRWSRTLLDGSAVHQPMVWRRRSRAKRGVVRVSTPTDITVDGIAGTYMERTVPARTKTYRCDEAQFRV